MAARRSLVHVGVTQRSISSGYLDVVEYFLGTTDVSLWTVLNVDPTSLALANLQVSAVDIYQIPQLLHVYLDERELQSKLNIVRWLSDSWEYGLNQSWDEPFLLCIVNIRPHAGVCFATWSLTVSEYRAVYSLKDTVSRDCLYLYKRSLATLWNTCYWVLSQENTRSNVKLVWLADDMPEVSLSLILYCDAAVPVLGKLVDACSTLTTLLFLLI